MKLGNRSIHKQSVNIVYKQGSKYVLWMEIEGESSPSTERQAGVVERVSTLVSDTLGFKSWLFHCVKLGALTFADRSGSALGGGGGGRCFNLHSCFA